MASNFHSRTENIPKIFFLEKEFSTNKSAKNRWLNCHAYNFEKSKNFATQAFREKEVESLRLGIVTLVRKSPADDFFCGNHLTFYLRLSFLRTQPEF